MVQQRQLIVAEQRDVTPDLRWLTLEAPELTRSVRAGQYLLVRCAEAGSYDPLLRRPLFVAATEPALGQIALLYAPNERGLAWLARTRAGDTLDVLGPCGRGFTLEPRTRTLLLIGAGPGLAALLLLARLAAAQQVAVTLLAGAANAELLPPAYLLPGEVEYQTFVPWQLSDFIAPGGTAATSSYNLPAAIAWADQVAVALPNAAAPALAQLIRTTKFRWERGFASALLEGPLICGVGACGVCGIELRKGMRMLCSDGPVFDLRDLP